MKQKTVEYQGRTYSHHQRHSLEMALMRYGNWPQYGRLVTGDIQCNIDAGNETYRGTGPTIWKALCNAVEQLNEGGN